MLTDEYINACTSLQLPPIYSRPLSSIDRQIAQINSTVGKSLDSSESDIFHRQMAPARESFTRLQQIAIQLRKEILSSLSDGVPQETILNYAYKVENEFLTKDYRRFIEILYICLGIKQTPEGSPANCKE